MENLDIKPAHSKNTQNNATVMSKR